MSGWFKRDIRGLPVSVGAWISLAVIIGLALLLLAVGTYYLACPWPRSLGTNCEAIADSPPWTMLTGLATAPALLLVWYWRTVHRQAEVRVAEEQKAIADQQRAIADEQKKIANQQQISARFADAVRLLSPKEKTETHIGAIFSLGNVVRDSEDDRRPVIETLASFIRLHAREDPEKSRHPRPRPDVRTALWVIGRLGAYAPAGRPEKWGLDKELDYRIHLDKTKLRKVHMRHARLTGARLRQAVLTGADLHGASLNRAMLTRAYLGKANLAGSNLAAADLTGANLIGADLSDVDLTDAKLKGAKYNTGTKFPAGFDPSAHDMIEVDLNGKPVEKPGEDAEEPAEEE